MAGLGKKTWNALDVLTAADMNGYLMDQSVMKFASSTARSSALGTGVSAGMVSFRSDGTAWEGYNGSAWGALVDTSTFVSATGTATLTNKTLTSPIITGGTATTPALVSPVFSKTAAETWTTSGTFAGYTFYADTSGAIQYLWTGNATANGAVNIAWSAGTSLNTYLATGQSVTVTLIIPNGATPYYPTSIQIDGTTSGVTTRWAGGTAPTSGNANSKDSYTFTVFKAGSATWEVFASQTKFA